MLFDTQCERNGASRPVQCVDVPNDSLCHLMR